MAGLGMLFLGNSLYCDLYAGPEPDNRCYRRTNRNRASQKFRPRAGARMEPARTDAAVDLIGIRPQKHCNSQPSRWAPWKSGAGLLRRV